MYTRFKLGDNVPSAYQRKAKRFTRRLIDSRYVLPSLLSGFLRPSSCMGDYGLDEAEIRSDYKAAERTCKEYFVPIARTAKRQRLSQSLICL